jgi:hypothetical protein
MARLDLESATALIEHLTEMMRKIKGVPIELSNKINKLQLCFRLYYKLHSILNQLVAQTKDPAEINDLGAISWSLYIFTKHNL